VRPHKIPETASQEIIKARSHITGEIGQLEKYDQQFKEDEKKHRNILSSFDHRFDVITHPFFIFLVFSVLIVVFIASRYIKNFVGAGCADFLDTIIADTQTAIKYLATVIVTAVFTRFIDTKGHGGYGPA
jgi:hypothetical protein